MENLKSYQLDPGRAELKQRIRYFESREVKVALYGTADVSLAGCVEPRIPTRPVHDPITGQASSRRRGVYASPPHDLDSPIWHASVLPHTLPYTAGRRLDYREDGNSTFTFMLNTEAAGDLIASSPIGGVYLLDARSLVPSPYNDLDLFSDGAVRLLDPEPTLVSYLDLSFDLRALESVSITRPRISPRSSNLR